MPDSSLLTLLSLVGLGVVASVAFMLLVGRKPAPSRPRAGPEPTAAAAAPGQASRKLTVAALVEQLARVGDEETVFLDRKTGRFIALGDEQLGALRGDDSLETEDHPDATDLEEIRAKLRSKVLLQLPTKAETREFQLKERFCETLPEGPGKDQMGKVLRAETGFRSFESAVGRLGLDREWRAFRDAEFARIATVWLERHRIPFV